MTRSDIENLETARREAMLAADTDALRNILAEGMTWIHASATVDTRSSFLAGFASGHLRCFRLDHIDTQIRLYHDTALVSGIVQMDVSVAQARRASANRYSAIYVQQSEGCRLIHWQSTRLPPPASSP